MIANVSLIALATRYRFCPRGTFTATDGSVTRRCFPVTGPGSLSGSTLFCTSLAVAGLVPTASP